MVDLKKAAKRFLITTVVVGATWHMNEHSYLTAEENKSPKIDNTKKIFEKKLYLQFSDRGKEVFHLQSFLIPFDYYRGVHDGVYGVLTKHAVKTYQKYHGLVQDGIAGPITMGHLLTHEKIIQAPNLPLPSSIIITENRPNTVVLSSTSENFTLYKGLVLKLGDSNEYVKQLQLKLKNHGYYKGIDGIYGPLTKSAVISYQKANKLHVDGIAGPETIGHMLNSEDVSNYEEFKETNELESSHDSNAILTDEATNLISVAKDQIGVPYIWGGTSPRGFDCSGFIQYIYNQKGVSIPRTVQDIWHHAGNTKEREIGDLVFFQTYQAGPSHMGIYLGDGQFIHAGSSTGVTISDINNSYWAPRYIGAKRID